jgi:ADP-ribose pyrophosphatase
MADASPDRIGTRRVYAGRLLNVDVDTVHAPDGTDLELEMVRHPGACAVVPLLSPPENEDPSVLLIEQYRYAAGGTIWEIPAGVLHPGEEPEACARRELEEETGARAGKIEHLTTILTTPGFTDERIHLFLATEITAGEPRLEVDEFIQVKAFTISRVLEMIRDGELRDAKSIVGLLYVAGYRLNL